MQSYLLLAILLSASSVHPQQHAPTVEVCRADLALWQAEINATKDSHSDVRKQLPFQELYTRKEEMLKCAVVDAGPSDGSNIARDVAYSDLISAYMSTIENRALLFIARHQMWQQFLDEDAAGNR